MFNPGETVCHQFTIPFLIDEISKVIISYKQDGNIVLEKIITSGFEDLDTKTKVSVLFTQEESLSFSENKCYTIQINVFTTDGTRAASKEIKGTSGVQHHKEVISNG